MPEKMQKTRNESDHPSWAEKTTGEKWPILISVDFLWFLDVFSAKDYQIHF